MGIIPFQDKATEAKILDILQTLNRSLPISSWPHINGIETDEISEGELENNPCLLICDSAYRGVNYKLAMYPVSFDPKSIQGGFIKKLEGGQWNIKERIEDLPRHSNLQYLREIQTLIGPEISNGVDRLPKGILVEVEYLPGIKRVGFFKGVERNQLILSQGHDLVVEKYESCSVITLNSQYYPEERTSNQFSLPHPSVDLVQRIRLLEE